MYIESITILNIMYDKDNDNIHIFFFNRNFYLVFADFILFTGNHVYD